MRSNPLRAFDGLALLALALAGAPLRADGEAWTGEVALFAGNHDNFFFRGGGNEAPVSDLLSGSFQVEREHDSGPGTWTFGFSGAAVTVADIDDADYQTLGVEAQYKRGPWKGSLSFGQLLNRLYSDSGEAVFFDQSEIDFWLRYSINRRLWVRLRTEVQDWDFDPLENSRDSDVDKYTVTVRWAASDRLGLRLSYLDRDRHSRGPENDRTGSGFAFAFEGQPNDRVTWFLRLRSRDRDYDNAPPEESNFNRSDTVDDVNFNLRWLFGERLGLMIRDNYRSGDSTRLDRNFTGNVVEAGIFFQFGRQGD